MHKMAYALYAATTCDEMNGPFVLIYLTCYKFRISIKNDVAWPLVGLNYLKRKSVVPIFNLFRLELDNIETHTSEKELCNFVIGKSFVFSFRWMKLVCSKKLFLELSRVVTVVEGNLFEIGNIKNKLDRKMWKTIELLIVQVMWIFFAHHLTFFFLEWRKCMIQNEAFFFQTWIFWQFNIVLTLSWFSEKPTAKQRFRTKCHLAQPIPSKLWEITREIVEKKKWAKENKINVTK